MVYLQPAVRIHASHCARVWGDCGMWVPQGVGSKWDLIAFHPTTPTAMQSYGPLNPKIDRGT